MAHANRPPSEGVLYFREQRRPPGEARRRRTGTEPRMDLLLVLVLAVVQGIAEFVPVSSSGHVAILAWFFGEAGHPLPDVLGLNIVLHGGTLVSILIVYWRRIARILARDRRVIGLVVVGTLPAVVVGLGLKKVWEVDLASPLLAASMLPITGVALLSSRRWPVGEIDYPQMNYGQALAIGAVQAVAILPGISRSGATILAGLGLGLRRDAAATFSFLLAVPAIAGACVLELLDLFGEPATKQLPPSTLLLGSVVSLIVGVLALRWLLNWLERGRLYQFGVWCCAFGGAVLGYLAWSRLAS